MPRNGSSPSDEAGRLARILGEHKGAILEAWMRRVAEGSASADSRSREPILLHYVVRLLDRLEHTLDESEPRFAPRCRVSEAARELMLLREVMFDVTAARGASLWGDAGRLVHRAIDCAMGDLALRVERAIAEERRANEERDALLAKATHDVIWDLDLMTNELRWLGALEGTFGYPLEEVAPTLDWWAERVHPDERDEIVKSIQDTIARGEDRWSAEYRFRRADGAYVPVFDRGCASRDRSGRPVRMIGSMVDLSARVRTEQALRDNEDRLRVALAAADVGIWDYRPLTGELTWDARLKSLWGLPPEAKVSYRTFLDGVHPEDRERVDAVVRRSFDPASGGTYKAEFRILDPRGGPERWLACEGRTFFDEQGRPCRFVGAVVDTTDRRREAEFRERFVGILGHDLRQPLSVVCFTAATLLRHKDLPPGYAHAIGRVMSAGERMNRMINDLLDFARGRQGGGFPISRVPCDLHRLIRQVIEEISTVHPAHTLRLSLTGSGEGEWDRDRMAQVFGNLVNNALIHGRSDAPVEILASDAGPDLMVKVTNQGTPIPPTELASLFNPYRRGTQRRVVIEGPQGLGLGLYITREIVRAHGGAIEVASDAEHGTAFTLVLPRFASPVARPPGSRGAVELNLSVARRRDPGSVERGRRAE